MIPHYFVELSALPHLGNGKVDRAALPDSFTHAVSPPPKTGPRTAAERFVVQLWQRLLGIENVGIEDRFFDLGGDSLNAVRAVTALRRRFGVKLPLRVILMDSACQVALACEPATPRIKLFSALSTWLSPHRT
jgi:acyl carrier protein